MGDARTMSGATTSLQIRRVTDGSSARSTSSTNTHTKLITEHGTPEHIRSDNGPEFVAKHLVYWLDALNVKASFITPGSPWENGFIESFNGRMRDEFLHGELFHTFRVMQSSNTPFFPPEGSSIQQFQMHLQNLRYSPSTVKVYTQVVEVFLRFHKHKRISDIDGADVLRFNNEYIIKRAVRLRIRTRQSTA